MAQASTWLEHVQNYRKSHPSLSYKEALVKASSSWTPQTCTKGAPKKRKAQKKSSA
jgi:hypothetical protein